MRQSGEVTTADDDFDAHLDVVLIGGREEREIEIVAYSDGWPQRFEVERQRIQGALGETARRIEHSARYRPACPADVGSVPRHR